MESDLGQELDPRISRTLTNSEILSVTGGIDLLAIELANLVEHGFEINSNEGPVIVSSGEFGTSILQEIADGRAMYDYHSNTIVVRDIPDRINGQLVSPRDFIRGRIRDDGSVIKASDYSVQEMLEDPDILPEVVQKGFLNFNSQLVAIASLIGEPADLSHVELQNRIVDAIRFLIDVGYCELVDHHKYSSNEFRLSLLKGSDPFSDFWWEEVLNSGANQDRKTGQLEISVETLPPSDPNSPFPSDLNIPNAKLARVVAHTKITGGSLGLSVVDHLTNSNDETIGISEETRIFGDNGIRPEMVIGRSAIWKNFSDLNRENVHDRDCVEVWIPRWGRHRAYDGYTVIQYDKSLKKMVAHDIDHNDYEGPYTNSGSVVPSILRNPTIGEIQHYFTLLGRYSFVADDMISRLGEYYFKGLNLEE